MSRLRPYRAQSKIHILGNWDTPHNPKIFRPAVVKLQLHFNRSSCNDIEVCCCRKNREEGESIAEGGGLSLSRVVCIDFFSDVIIPSRISVRAHPNQLITYLSPVPLLAI